uniref:Reverse transcriptase domain-containing protein n=1 Tax=Oryza glumipatula TaxID=40148 RepID=A0A0E0BKH9_9ORYZ
MPSLLYSPSPLLPLLGIPYWVSLYVDDVMVFLHPSEDRILATKEILGIIGDAPGLHTNYGKYALTRKWTRLPRLASLPGHYLPLGLASLNPEASPRKPAPHVGFAATGGVGIVVGEVAFQVKILRWTEGGGRGRVGKVFLDEKILGAAAAGGGRGPGRGPVTLGEVFLEEKVLGAAVAGGGAGGTGTSPSVRSSSNRAFMEDSKPGEGKPWSGSGRLRVFLDMLLVLVLGASRHGRRTMARERGEARRGSSSRRQRQPWEMYTLDTTIDLKISTTSRRSPTGPSRRCACPLTSSSIVN